MYRKRGRVITFNGLFGGMLKGSRRRVSAQKHTGRHYITLHVIQLTRLSKATHNFVERQNAEISTNDIQRDVFGSLYGLHMFHNSHVVYVCPLSRTPGISGGRGSDKRSNRRKKRDGSQTLPRKYMSLGICAFLFYE